MVCDLCVEHVVDVLYSRVSWGVRTVFTCLSVHCVLLKVKFVEDDLNFKEGRM